MIDDRLRGAAWTCHGRLMDGAAGDGARTRSLKLGKVTVRFVFWRALIDAFAQLELFTVPASLVIVCRGRATWSDFAGKNINQGMSTSPCKVTDPRKLEPTAIEWKWLHCSAMGCESGRQDSNLRPLVPQTSPYFQLRSRVQKEWFCQELVGMTTRPGAMESIGIPSTRTHACWTFCPSPTARHFAAFWRRSSSI
jgi:hypothetical protein